MASYNKKMEIQLRNLFKELTEKTEGIITSSRTNSEATDRIMRLVSGRLSAEAEGYMVDLYAELVERIKADDYFADPEHLNAFYRLNIREELNEKYHFDIESIDAYKKGIQYKEINMLYAAAGSAAGTMAVGGILKHALSNDVNLPFVIVIAGALIVACATYVLVSIRNKKEYIKAVHKFLRDLENEILDWFVDIEVYFDEKVRTLYK